MHTSANEKMSGKQRKSRGTTKEKKVKQQKEKIKRTKSTGNFNKT